MIKKIKFQNKKGFTILEMMISMTLFALIITSVLLAVESLSIARIKTLNRVALLEELYYFSENLFTGIKDGGTIDYEEYWNRMSIGTATQSGHYQNITGMGNYGSGGNIGTTSYGQDIYLCRSDSGSIIGSNSGCLSGNNNGGAGFLSGASGSYNGSAQRYGEYLAQYTDYNGNGDDDYGDEDSDASGSIYGDDDDKSLGNAPEILTGSINELYLINKTAKTRTYYRWNIMQDPGTTIACSPPANGSGMSLTNSGCIGNVQVLKLSGLDIGSNHDSSLTGGAYNGVIDTWVCTEDWEGCRFAPMVGPNQHLATGSGSEWVNLFPSTINVKHLSFQVYPIKDPWLSWSAGDCIQDTLNPLYDPNCISPFIHPYVRMNLEMGFSWGKRRTLRNEDPSISIATSISLSDFN